MKKIKLPAKNSPLFEGLLKSEMQKIRGGERETFTLPEVVITSPSGSRGADTGTGAGSRDNDPGDDTGTPP